MMVLKERQLQSSYPANNILVRLCGADADQHQTR